MRRPGCGRYLASSVPPRTPPFCSGRPATPRASRGGAGEPAGDPGSPRRRRAPRLGDAGLRPDRAPQLLHGGGLRGLRQRARVHRGERRTLRQPAAALRRAAPRHRLRDLPRTADLRPSRRGASRLCSSSWAAPSRPPASPRGSAPRASGPSPGRGPCPRGSPRVRSLGRRLLGRLSGPEGLEARAGRTGGFEPCPVEKVAGRVLS